MMRYWTLGRERCKLQHSALSDRYWFCFRNSIIAGAFDVTSNAEKMLIFYTRSHPSTRKSNFDTYLISSHIHIPHLFHDTVNSYFNPGEIIRLIKKMLWTEPSEMIITNSRELHDAKTLWLFHVYFNRNITMLTIQLFKFCFNFSTC